MKKTLALVLAASMALSLTACGGGSPKETTAAAKAGESTSAAGGEQKPVTLTFWHRDGNTTSNPIYAQLIEDFQKKYPWITIEYTGLASDSYMTKFNTAVVTGETPDVATISDKDLYTLVAQDALLPMDEAFASWEESKNILPEIVESARYYARDDKFYMYGYGKTQETSWYNTKWHEEQGIEPATTIDQLVEYSKKYSDKSAGKYYFSLRGGSGSAENLFMFALSYAGIPTFFNEDGTSTLSDPKVAEGIEAYANLYKESLVSVDAISNGYREMVAEFGSGSAQYIMHNSSSVSEHEKNLGEGSFMPIKPLAGKDGIAVCKSPTFMGSVVFKSTKHPEEATLFAQYLASAEGAGYVDWKEGRVPVNTGIYEQDWYKENPYFATYAKYAEEGVEFAMFPIWLDDYAEYAKTTIVADFQAILHGDGDSATICKKWADDLTKMQQEYLAEK